MSGHAAPVARAALDAPGARRVQALQARFAHIAATRMAGLPFCHAGLHTEAVGFAPDGTGTGWAGVLITPWFMNLVWLPADVAAAEPVAPLAVGASRARRVGSQTFDFIGADEEGIGPFEACSLFSPMAEFQDQAAARATAEAVVALLHDAAPAHAAAPSAGRGAPAAPSRRGFLTGRAER